ncbi:hypothetical protein [Gemmobacter sp. LW-1]|uniref:hypothetical protein n=1 Tax=Gemmobacter sp. LW-1 TaxID=1529005 RepID=UPI000A5BDAAB|nr:hypothetical protein [Gemmobacter sp. LW-1]
MTDLRPDFTTPEELAPHFRMSVRAFRDLVRNIGACCVFGRTLAIFPEHMPLIKEATQCRMKSTSGGASGTTGAPLPGGGYEALQARLTKQQRSASRRKPKQENGAVISMAPRKS